MQADFSYNLSEFISTLHFITFQSDLLSITLANRGKREREEERKKGRKKGREKERKKGKKEGKKEYVDIFLPCCYPFGLTLTS